MNAATTVEIGSSEHRRLLARFFLDTHVDYVPEKIQWPQLPESAWERLKIRLPDIAGEYLTQP